MLICSCNIITKSEIEETIISLLDDDAWQLITPGKIYHAMSVKGKCCGCFPNLISMIIATTENYHRVKQTPEAEILPFIQKLKDEHYRCETARKLAQMKKRKSFV